MPRTTVLTSILLVLAMSGATAQEPTIACQTQQELEQVIASGGQIMPDGCRSMSITPLETDEAHLCMLDFTAGDEGIVSQLREVAVNEQWWVSCADLEAAASE